MNEISYSAPQEYPVPERLCYNACDIRMLMELYSGADSELTAIMQYVYQETMLHSCHEDVAKALSEIAKVEMHHMQLLGMTIRRMGGNPQYIRPCQKQYWQAGLVNYTCDPCSMLLANLKGELDAVDAYLAVAKKLNNRCAAPLLERIAMDEKIHAEILQCMIRSIGCCR